MTNVKDFLKNKLIGGRAIGFYLALGSAILMLLSDIVFAIVDAGDKTFSIVTFVLILLGVAIEIAHVFLDFDFFSILSCVCYGIAFGMHLYVGLPSVSDIWNGVVFNGGNAMVAIIFSILFFIGTVVTIVSCFIERDKKVD